MDDDVLPTLQRLLNALDIAATSTRQISAIMKDAEDQAANVLKGAGSVALTGMQFQGARTGQARPQCVRTRLARSAKCGPRRLRR